MKSKSTSSQYLPKAPRFTLAMLGPGVVLIAMGLGSGEFVLWPYLAAQYGLGLLWGAIIGVTLQYIISNESGRYSLATGDNVFVGFWRLSKVFPFWFVLSTFLSFAWPGIIGSAGEIFAHMFAIEDPTIVTVSLLIFIGLILTFGGRVYSNVKRVQKIFIVLAVPALLLFVALLINPELLIDTGLGLVGVGPSYILLPATLSVTALLGGIAYAGAGGNLVLSHSLYIQDEGLGMAQGVDSEIALGKKTTNHEPRPLFIITPASIRRFKKWMKNTTIEQGLTFWLIGIVTIILLSMISYSLTYPFDGQQGLDFVFLEAEGLQQRFGMIAGEFFFLIGGVFLVTTQLGVFEATSRIMTENIVLVSSKLRKISKSTIFFVLLWSQIVFALLITLLKIAQPLQILLVNTFFSAISMFVLTGAVLWLNSSTNILPRQIQPSWFRKLILLSGVLFFGAFVAITIADIV